MSLLKERKKSLCKQKKTILLYKKVKILAKANKWKIVKLFTHASSSQISTFRLADSPDVEQFKPKKKEEI